MKLFKNFLRRNKLYGSTVVGSKGQVVIPARARRDLRIKQGDTLIVIGKMGRALGLIKSEALGELLQIVMNNIERFGSKTMKQELEEHVKRMFKFINKKK